ncbi:GGDEF domain-containing protein [Deinococcus sp. YIM 77859]|uniref:GGDEF domain-containing protein n=1 Tax=Deinococcus sp. YIM 77859 TaxID=1540221 RepID=UPI000A4DC905|nr:GGDEF domain-containing protein [Deinococcus sp. YIM 77859]
MFRRNVDRRELYQLLLPLALLGMLLPLALPVPGTFLAAHVPWLAVPLALTLLLALVPRCPLWVLDLLLLAGGWSAMLGQVAALLLLPNVPGRVTALTQVVPWFLVLLLVPTWVLGERRGQIVSAAALGTTLLLGITFVIGPLPAWGDMGSALLQLLVQLLLAGGTALLGQHAAARRARVVARQGAGRGLPDHARDPLTGLPGRRALERVLAAQLPHRGAGLAVAVLTMDGLQEVQEERGVAFAEALRAHVARTLNNALRDEDVLGCLGQGAFAVLMRVPDARFARTNCERLRVRVASRPLGGVLPTVSVGVAVWSGEPTGDALLQHARDALVCAQQDGGNRVHLTPNPESPAHTAPAA